MISNHTPEIYFLLKMHKYLLLNRKMLLMFCLNNVMCGHHKCIRYIYIFDIKKKLGKETLRKAKSILIFVSFLFHRTLLEHNFCSPVSFLVSRWIFLESFNCLMLLYRAKYMYICIRHLYG